MCMVDGEGCERCGSECTVNADGGSECVLSLVMDVGEVWIVKVQENVCGRW